MALAHDLDFSAILAATRGDQHSVVQMRSENVSPEVVGPAVISAVRQMTSELNEGALLTVEPGRMRVRLLPLRPG